MFRGQDPHLPAGCTQAMIDGPDIVVADHVHTRWVCGGCGCSYDNDIEALACNEGNACQGAEIALKYICDLCDTLHDEEEGAEDCVISCAG